MITRRLIFVCSAILFFGVYARFNSSIGKAESGVLSVESTRLELSAVDSSPVPSVDATTTALRVLSWNIQFGRGTDDITNYDRLANWIANLNPDLIGLCEIPPGDAVNLVSLLTQKTGQLWFTHFVPKYPGCNEGNLILSRYPIIAVNFLFLSTSRSVAEATISVGGTNVSFFATHLDDAASSNRVAEVDQLKQWAANFSEPRIFTGDFNAGPDTPEALSMTQAYSDSWNDMVNLGTATAYADNPVGLQTRTRRGRIDYVFSSRGSSTLVPRRSKIPDTRDLNNTNVVITLGTLDDKGVRPSDHNPMTTDFDVTTASNPTPTPTPAPIPTPTPTPTPVSGTPATVQFSTSSYAVAENSIATITVTRSGDLSGTTSVSYTTADISAQQLGDYILAAGRLTFAPGENQKSFVVLIVDDGYSEATETFSVTLGSPSAGAVVGSIGTASVSISDNDATSSTISPLNNATFFVQQHYMDFLNRKADDAGLNFWSNQILLCGGDIQCLEVKRINVSAAFFLSIEFQHTAFLACLANKAAFGGFPSYALFIRDSQALRNNYIFGQPGASAQLETNKQLYFDDFVSRSTFHSRFDGMSNDQYVDALIASTKLTLAALERQSLIDGLNGGTQTRATVLRKFAEDLVFGAREFNSVFVLTEYFGYLRRDADPVGFDFWLGKLNSFNGNFVKADMVKAFILSAEYSQRFGPVPLQ